MIDTAQSTFQKHPWIDKLCCPRCRRPLKCTVEMERFHCSNVTCQYYSGFQTIEGRPALFDEERTIVNTAATKNVDGRSAVERRRITRSWLGKVHRFVVGGNPVAKQNAERFVDQLTRRRPDAERYDVLIIGSGTVGEGSERIYREPRFRIFGVDIYVSSTVTILADAHDLPFADGSIDAVWIQAVLEHVVDPERCVSEIHRVLSPGGVVYSETPFMQQVHEGPYDFLRFSHSGHRWLFRRFEELNSGAINGPATALVWSIRYFVLALSGSKVLARVCFAALGWLRAFDHMVSDDRKILGASGFFFLGEKSESTITLRHIVSYFRGQPG